MNLSSKIVSLIFTLFLLNMSSLVISNAHAADYLAQTKASIAAPSPSDPQVRQLFEEDRDDDDDDEYKYNNEDMARFIFLQDAENRKKQLSESLARWPEQQARLIQNLTAGRGIEGLYTLFGIFTLMMATGLTVERIASYKMNAASRRLADEKNSSFTDNLNYFIMQLVFKLVGIAIFVAVSGAIAAYVYEFRDPFRILSLHMLVLIVKIRVLSILLRLVLAPYEHGNRLFKIACVPARKLYFSIMIFMIAYLSITSVWRILGHFDIEPIMFALIIPGSGFILNIMSIGFLWYNRKTFAELFTEGKSYNSSFARFLTQAWPMVLTVWLVVIWFIWATYEFLGYFAQSETLTPVWWLTFTFPILDRLVFVALTQLKRIAWLQSHSFERRCDKFIRRVMIALRVIFFTIILYLMDASFGYNAWQTIASSLGRFLEMFLDVLVVLILAYAIWEVIQSAIERHLPYDIACAGQNQGGLSSLEGDGGGAGASRSETLLPLVRSFMLVFLLASVLLTVLSILGVEIAPLLAGAGIVGIAVGFGAQKLVQDVISGIFFLLDDAFRRGEYIEAANLRGTVERISIRSISLRHHLGAVQTIPFSEIATVRNLSRDWITMKLEFRLDYHTDVEKVRKLIKKVGQKMQEHPEYGPHFLLPLKSQGVIRVEESALIFRMKFTCVPGEQWVIRREAFRLVKEALKANDIEFAHRSVHVLMQNNEPEKGNLKEAIEQSDALTPQLAGAAASSVTNAIQRNDKIDSDFD